MSNSFKQFKKGDKALALDISSSGESGLVHINLTTVTVESFGKKQGTATKEGGKFCGYRFYVLQSAYNLKDGNGGSERFEIPSLVSSVEDALALATDRNFALRLGQSRIDGHLHCRESNFPHLLPQYRARAQAEIDRLKTTKPSFVIRLDGAPRSPHQLKTTMPDTTTKPVIDFRVNNQGSIYILTPVSPGAQEWASEHLPADAQRWGPNGIVIEHRYIQDIIDGLEAEGFVGRLI